MNFSDLIAAIQSLAADLQSSGAVRSEHWTKWTALRTQLDQLADAARQAEQRAAATAEAEAPETISAKVDAVAIELADLAGVVRGLAARLTPGVSLVTEPEAA